MQHLKPIDVNRQLKLTPPSETVTPEKSSVIVNYKITPTETKLVYIYRDISDFSSSDKRFLLLLLVAFFGLGFLFLSIIGVPK